MGVRGQAYGKSQPNGTLTIASVTRDWMGGAQTAGSPMLASDDPNAHDVSSGAIQVNSAGNCELQNSPL
jgi:hypothetical protein